VKPQLITNPPSSPCNRCLPFRYTTLRGGLQDHSHPIGRLLRWGELDHLPILCRSSRSIAPSLASAQQPHPPYLLPSSPQHYRYLHLSFRHRRRPLLPRTSPSSLRPDRHFPLKLSTPLLHFHTYYPSHPLPSLYNLLPLVPRLILYRRLLPLTISLPSRTSVNSASSNSTFSLAIELAYPSTTVLDTRRKKGRERRVWGRGKESGWSWRAIRGWRNWSCFGLEGPGEVFAFERSILEECSEVRHSDKSQRYIVINE
jgi:hypothetical protein